MSITIEELPATATPTVSHVIPSMKDGVTVKLTVSQISSLVAAVLVDGSPATLDTLNELAAALGDDPNFAATITAALAEKASLTGAETLTNKTLTSPVLNTPTLVLKQSSSPTPTAEGAIEWDSDDDAIVVGTGAGQKIFRSGGWVTLLDATLSSAANYSAISIPSNASLVEVTFANVAPANNATNLFIRTSGNNGSSYDLGASDYDYNNVISTVGGSIQETGAAAQTAIALTTTIGNAAGRDISGTLRIYNPGSMGRTSMTWNIWGLNSSGAFVIHSGGGRRNSGSAVDAIQFFFGSGNIASGRITTRYIV